MKKLLASLVAALSVLALSVPALADIAPHRPADVIAESGAGKWVVAVVVAVVIVAVVIIVGAVRYRRNNK